jgi:hypothetical protein
LPHDRSQACSSPGSLRNPKRINVAASAALSASRIWVGLNVPGARR